MSKKLKQKGRETENNKSESKELLLEYFSRSPLPPLLD